MSIRLLQLAVTLTAATLTACVCGPKKQEPAPAPAPVAVKAEAPPPAPKGKCPPTAMEDGKTVVSLAYPTGNEATSVLCLQKVAPAQVTAGETFSYELRITNLTSDPISNITINDRLPSGFSMASATPPASADSSWKIAKLGPGETQKITITGMAGSDGKLTNCADLSIDNNLCVETAVNTPKVQITKEGPDAVLACDPINYKIVVTNTGTGTARDLVVTDTLPEGLVTMDGQNSITANIAELAGGASQEINATVKATKTGSFSNSASVADAGGVSAASNAVTTVVTKPALELNVACPGKTYLGKKLCYTVTVANNGDGVSRGTTVSAVVPSGTSFVSASEGGTNAGGNVSWNAGDLAPGASKSREFCVMADTLGPKQTGATASGYCADAVKADCATNVEGIPAILVEVIDIEDPIQVGNQETYEILITNQGTANDTNIKVVCGIEEQLEYVASADPGGKPGVVEGGSISFEAHPSIAPKAKIKYIVKVKATATGDTRFKVTVTSDQLTRPVEETEATNHYD